MKREDYNKLNILRKGCYVLLFTSALSVILCVYLMIKMSGMTKKEEVAELTEEISYSQQQVDELIATASENASIEGKNEIRNYVRTCIIDNIGTGEMLRQMFPEYVVYPGNGTYNFAEISDNIPANTISANDITTMDNGIRIYAPDGNKASKVCIDVSQHNGEINWEAVAESGLVDVVMIRVGYRGYGSGKLVLDEQFENNIKGAVDAGFPVGVYFFSQATNEAEIQEEADFIFDAIGQYSVTGPIVIDIEKLDDSEARGNQISKEERTQLVDQFCQIVISKGHTPMIYGNTYSFFDMLDLEKLSEYDVWYAFYDSYLYYPYVARMWQYSAGFTIPGISEKVDMNIMFE